MFPIHVEKSEIDVPKRISICRIPVFGSLLVRGLNGFAGPATFMAVRNPMKPEIKHAFLYPYDNWDNRVAVWRFVKDIPKEKNHPSRNLLQETADSLGHYKDTPVLACWGMRDFCFQRKQETEKLTEGERDRGWGKRDNLQYIFM